MADGLLVRDDQTQDHQAAGPTAWRYAPILVVALGLCAGYALGWQHYLSIDFLADSRETLKAEVAEHFWWSVAGFFMFYVLAVAFSFPAATILTIFAGFLFGVLVGGAVVAVAATLGATILFLAARTALRDVLRRRLDGRLGRLADGFEKDAFSYLLVLRLAPIFPFFVVNIAPAFFEVRTRTYVAATFFGILPGTFAYAYLGKGIESVLVSVQQPGERLSAGDLVTPEITLALAALALVAGLAAIVKKLRTR